MIETRRLKIVVIFIQATLSFVLSRKIHENTTNTEFLSRYINQWFEEKLLFWFFFFFNPANFPEVPLKIKDKSRIWVSKIIKLGPYNSICKEVQYQRGNDQPGDRLTKNVINNVIQRYSGNKMMCNLVLADWKVLLKEMWERSRRLF